MEKFPSLNKHIQIAININSSDLSINRRWPVENFRKLISFMQRDWNNLQIYLVGGERDLPQVRSFYETLPDKTAVFIAAAKFDILEFSYALSKMLCLITNDSGPLHIAEALGVPVVSFFGPETPNLYGPLLDKSLTFYKNLFCSPCLNVYNYKMSNCDDNRCLKLISPEEVYENIKTRYFNNDLCAALPS